MKTTPRKFMKKLKELEPKGIVDYILRGSALNQYLNKFFLKKKK